MTRHLAGVREHQRDRLLRALLLAPDIDPIHHTLTADSAKRLADARG